MKRAIVIAAVVLSSTLLAAQQQVVAPPTKTSPEKPTVPQKPHSPCPDGAFQAACDSYAELLRANDFDVAMPSPDKPGFRLVCFRGAEDAFFIVNAQPRGTVPSTDRVEGWVEVLVFQAGIRAREQSPGGFYAGEWSGWQNFIASNAARGAEGGSSRVSLDYSQLTLSMVYKNSLGISTDYNLAIQRSTGRFSERWTVRTENAPPIASGGRCVAPPVSYAPQTFRG